MLKGLENGTAERRGRRAAGGERRRGAERVEVGAALGDASAHVLERCMLSLAPFTLRAGTLVKLPSFLR